jgi:hypothetical protein
VKQVIETFNNVLELIEREERELQDYIRSSPSATSTPLPQKKSKIRANGLSQKQVIMDDYVDKMNTLRKNSSDAQEEYYDEEEYDEEVEATKA